MQNKGVIRFLAIILALVCVYQLTFTWKANSVRKDAEKYAKGDFDKELYYLDSVSGEEVYNFLGLKKYTFRECQERELNLGLDLKGGMSVILEVSVVDIIKSLSNYSKDTTFLKTIALAQEMQKQSQEDFVTLFNNAFQQVAPNGQLAQFFYTNPALKGEIDFNSSNENVMEVIRRETKDAIDNSFNILRNRIDRFGVAQPNIQRLETRGRIMVELPGVKDPERVRGLLQSTAKLEFWETYDNREVYQYMLEANEVISKIEKARKATAGDSLDKKSEDSLLADLETGEEELVVADTMPEVAAEDVSDEMKSSESGSLLDEMGAEDTGELSLLEEIEQDTGASDTGSIADQQMMEDFPLFAVLRPNVTQDQKVGQGPVIGFAHHKDISTIDKYLNMQKVKSLFPRDLQFYWGAKPPRWDESESVYALYAIKVSGREGKAPLDGDVVTNARAEFGQNQATAEVTMSMNSKGAKVWARLTRENVGNSIAIVLDDRVYSAPNVNQEITGGNSSITGDFDVNEAKDLANVLKSGKLPAPAKIIHESIVGPSLGQEAINSGFNSFLIAFLVIMLYMVFYYSRRAGLVADFALIANMFFLIGVLASLQAVLTLPGIAGIVLTIGMSVDANVLIYERIREELRAGKGATLAIKDGYKNAYSAIIDANVTTLLTAIILYIFGTGPIRGFATTLIIGILTSLFSAIFITRLIFEGALSRKRMLSFATNLTQGAFTNLKISFIDRSKVFFVISAIIIGIGVYSLVTRGLNAGVDFTGGRNYVVRFDHDVEPSNIRDLLTEKFGETPQVILFGEEDQVRITTQYKIDDRSAEVDDEIEKMIFEGVKPVIHDSIDLETFLSDYRQRSEKVGPTIADDIKKQAVWAILFSLIIMFIYIMARFRKWQYGLGAVGALVHDTLIVLGLFSLFYNRLPFSLEIDQAFIAAILTVVGYSINDTVVVFDRVREFMREHPKWATKDIFNSGLNSTLSRTFSTSISTFVVLLTIFIFGGEVIRGFTFALLVGVVVGTYSSLFIATPIAYRTINKKREVAKGKKKK